MADFRSEFPDYPAADMPALPPSLADSSWRNEACPSFIDEAANVQLFVDYADPQAREFPPPEFDSKRYTLHWLTNSGDVLAILTRGLGFSETVFCATDDLAEALQAYERARRVSMGVMLAEILRESLRPADLAECAAGRADPCDFIDDNDATADAYRETFGADLTDAFGTAEEDSALARANVATVVAARLLRGEQPTCADLLATVARDFPKGLSHTITRAGDFESNVRQCLEG